jgi:hypothetical protein
VRVWGVDPGGDVWMLGGRRAGCAWIELADAILGNLKDQHRGERPAIDGLFGSGSRSPGSRRTTTTGRRSSRSCCAGQGGGRARPHRADQPNGGDKATRAQGAQAMAAMGRIHIPEGSDGENAIQELIGFPTSRP